MAHERLGEGDARTLPPAQRTEVRTLLTALRCQADRLDARPDVAKYWADKFTLAPAEGAC